MRCLKKNLDFNQIFLNFIPAVLILRPNCVSEKVGVGQNEVNKNKIFP